MLKVGRVKVMLVCQKNDAFVNGSHNWQSSLIGQITTQLLLCTAFGGTYFIFFINITLVQGDRNSSNRTRACWRLSQPRSFFILSCSSWSSPQVPKSANSWLLKLTIWPMYLFDPSKYMRVTTYSNLMVAWNIFWRSWFRKSIGSNWVFRVHKAQFRRAHLDR